MYVRMYVYTYVYVYCMYVYIYYISMYVCILHTYYNGTLSSHIAQTANTLRMFKTILLFTSIRTQCLCFELENWNAHGQ